MRPTFVAFFLAQTCDASLTVVAPESLAATTRAFDVAAFRYYGPQPSSESSTNEALVEGPAVVLEGADLCVVNSTVRGAIVVVGEDWPRYDFSACGVFDSLGKLYERVDAAGAIGLVYVATYSSFYPGTIVENFDNFDKCKYCSHHTVLVHVEPLGGELLEAWREVGPQLRLRLDPPVQNDFQEMTF